MAKKYGRRKNNVYVKLFQDKFRDRYDTAKFKYRDAKRKARISYQSAKLKARISYQSEKDKFLGRRMAARARRRMRSVTARNRMVRSARNYADRMQLAWSRSLVRVATSYRKHISKNAASTSSTMSSMQQTPTSSTPMTVQKSVPVTLTEYSEPSWFCPSTGRPLTSKDATGRFVNPWLSQSTDGVKSILEIAQWQWERAWRRTQMPTFVSTISQWFFLGSPWRAVEQQQQQQLATTTTTATSEGLPSSSSSSCSSPPSLPLPTPEICSAVPYNRLKFTWIGHNTCLVQQGPISILTDPIFSTRSSPFQSLPVGVARDVPAAVEIDDLPAVIDVCVVSHDHYDHLDKDSVLALKSKVNLWVVPTGIQEWLQEKCSIDADSVVELEWWESVKLEKGGCCGDSDDDSNWKVAERHSPTREAPTAAHPALSDPDVQYAATDGGGGSRSKQAMWITCCPVQHWASRTFFDRNFRLWGSFAVFLPGSKFFFGGDTALPEKFPLFDQIRDYIGGDIDLAALPIGAYEPAFFMKDAHMGPEDAVQVHQALGAKQSVAIHWGTFALSEEPLSEPPLRLQEAASKVDANFVAVRHGESITVDCREAQVDVTAADDSTANSSDYNNNDQCRVVDF